MTFYVKQFQDSEIEGPFTIEQINQLVRQKHLTCKSLAVADMEQGLPTVRNAPPKQWRKLADIPGYEPDPRGERKYVALILIIGALLVLIPITVLIILVVLLNRIH